MTMLSDPAIDSSHTKPSDTYPTPTSVACKNLCGPEYFEYITRTLTYSLGGVSPVKRAQLARQLFNYKLWGPLATSDNDDKLLENSTMVEMPSPTAAIKVETPSDGNEQVSSIRWTTEEHLKMDTEMRACARWEVDHVSCVV